MELAINLIQLLLGITILVWGANKFVDHSSVIAKHLGINDLVVGLTLIAAGTSAPEIFVAISAVINGNEDIAFGTAIGSNISNIALIFGVSCLYLSTASKTHLSNLIPFGLSILMLGLIIVDGKISSFYKDYVLNEQTFCNPEFYEGQVGTMIEELSGKLGEKIYIKKFSRIEVGT